MAGHLTACLGNGDVCIPVNDHKARKVRNQQRHKRYLNFRDCFIFLMNIYVKCICTFTKTTLIVRHKELSSFAFYFHDNQQRVLNVILSYFTFEIKQNQVKIDIDLTVLSVMGNTDFWVCGPCEVGYRGGSQMQGRKSL